MKKYPLICFALFFVSLALQSRDTLYLTDYLPRYHNDAALATYHALEDCRKQTQPVLVLPEGELDFYPQWAYEREVKMTNNINGRKRIALPVVDQNKLTVLGQDTRIRLHGVMMGMIVHDSREVTIKGLSFDWETPFYLQGRVERVDTLQRSYVLRLREEERVTVRNDDIIVHRAEGDYQIGGNYWFDPVTRQPVYAMAKRRGRGWNPYQERHYRLEQLDARRIRVHNQIDSLPRPGWHFIAKWRNQPNVNRTAPAIHLQESLDLRLQDIGIYAAAGMGIIGERCESVDLLRVTVEPTPGKDRIISTTADATHFVNCRGLVRIEDCRFEACLDDGLNIHGNYATCRAKVAGGDGILAEIVHVQQLGFRFAGAEDSLAFIDPTTLLPVGDPVRVDSVIRINDGLVQIWMSGSLPDQVEGLGLENLSWQADLIFRRDTVRRNWARGVLFKTAGRVLIEDNYLSPSMSALRNWGEMNFFNESGRTEDVLIRRNTIIDVARVANGQPAIVIFPQNSFSPDAPLPGYYNRNIRIEDNLIFTFDRPILYAQSTDGLVFRNNRIEQTDSYRPFFPDRPTLDFRYCREVEVLGNVFEQRTPPIIRLDEFTKSSANWQKELGTEFE